MTTPPAALPELPAEEDDPAVTRILDAALELFEDVGIRKSTIEDVARRAGIDRVTVYRRVGSKNEVTQAVLAREAQRIFERVAAGVESVDSPEDRVVAAFTGLVQGLRDHAVYTRLIKLEPTETLTKMTTEASGVLSMAILWAVDRLITPAPDAEARPDATARVEVVARVIHSMVMTRHGVLTLDTEEQLADFARTYIAPIVTR